ncbi:hypothetical protein HYX17_02625 [Candidatus Woesearchaeota archaeon]|nr:hypothetical protein [Candidatus Woesearchaeota archaeon]
MDQYLTGLFVGDGSIHLGKNWKYQVWIDQHNRNADILKKAAEILQKEGFNVCVYKIPDNKIRVYVCAKRLFTEFSEVKKNPVNHFLNLNENDKKEFVAGFFDAEGTVTDRFVIYNGNITLLQAIEKFLKKLGIVCYIYRFGKIFGIQIYQKKSVEKFVNHIKCIKISRISG